MCALDAGTKVTSGNGKPMTEAVNIFKAGHAGAPSRTTAVVSAPGSAPGSASAEPQIQRISPSIRFDASAGVMITEYFNHKGEVQTQIPSAASVAYLRVGMTSDGESRKEEPGASEGKTAPVLA